jgi:hypothetical protein
MIETIIEAIGTAFVVSVCIVVALGVRLWFTRREKWVRHDHDLQRGPYYD